MGFGSCNRRCWPTLHWTISVKFSKFWHFLGMFKFSSPARLSCWDFVVGSWGSINEWCLIAWVSFTVAIFPWFPLALSADLLDIVNVTIYQSCLWWSAEDDRVGGECGGVAGKEAGGGEGGGGEGAHLLLGQTPRGPHDKVGFTTENQRLNWMVGHFFATSPCQFTHWLLFWDLIDATLAEEDSNTLSRIVVDVIVDFMLMFPTDGQQFVDGLSAAWWEFDASLTTVLILVLSTTSRARCAFRVHPGPDSRVLVPGELTIHIENIYSIYPIHTICP